jgi:hypothetical protein
MLTSLLMQTDTSKLVREMLKKHIPGQAVLQFNGTATKTVAQSADELRKQKALAALQKAQEAKLAAKAARDEATGETKGAAASKSPDKLSDEWKKTFLEAIDAGMPAAPEFKLAETGPPKLRAIALQALADRICEHDIEHAKDKPVAAEAENGNGGGDDDEDPSGAFSFHCDCAYTADGGKIKCPRKLVVHNFTAPFVEDVWRMTTRACVKRILDSLRGMHRYPDSIFHPKFNDAHKFSIDAGVSHGIHRVYPDLTFSVDFKGDLEETDGDAGTRKRKTTADDDEDDEVGGGSGDDDAGGDPDDDEALDNEEYMQQREELHQARKQKKLIKRQKGDDSADEGDDPVVLE